MCKQKATKTDRLTSTEAGEFMWDMADATETHRYVGPVLLEWLHDLRSSRTLDLGCGNGALTACLAPIAGKIVGMDMSESGIRIAQGKYPQVVYFRNSMEVSLPQEHRGAYDLVVATEVIEHLFRPRALLDRAKEALKPGGYIIVTAPYHGYWKNLALALTGKFDEHWHPLRDYGHIKFFSQQTLSMLLKERGFGIKRWARVGRFPALARSMIVLAKLR